MAPQSAPSADVGPIDSHCHLQLLEGDECNRALDAAREAGVRGFLAPAISLLDADRLLELCEREGDVWCALGVHPHAASTWAEGDQDRLLDLLKEPHVVAVGECGLDFHYDLSPRDEQIAAMHSQWEVALEADMPVIVHNRESDEVMLRALGGGEFGRLRGVFHSFAAGLGMARQLLAHGLYIGISGMVTFKAAENVREVLPVAPSDRILVETDTPYLAPVPYRGKPNQPAYVVEIVNRIASETGASVEEVAASSSRAFFELFPKAAGMEQVASASSP